jgi:hypothetical protein
MLSSGQDVLVGINACLFQSTISIFWKNGAGSISGSSGVWEQRSAPGPMLLTKNCPQLGLEGSFNDVPATRRFVAQQFRDRVGMAAAEFWSQREKSLLSPLTMEPR